MLDGVVVGSVLAAVLFFLAIETVSLRRLRHRLPIRIEVTGTRGKSSVVRLITAGLTAAGAAGLLYWPIDENGWPIDIRVARHVRTMEKITELWSRFHKDRPMVVTGLPTYQAMIENGIGHYFADPSTIASDRLAHE